MNFIVESGLKQKLIHYIEVADEIILGHNEYGLIMGVLTSQMYEYQDAQPG
jgi:hypothetical protein